MAAGVLNGSASPAAGAEWRTPPHNYEAEQIVLGVMMESPDVAAEVERIVRASDFYRPAHALLFDAIVDQHARKEPADAFVLAEVLNRAGNLTKVGGAPYLHTCVSRVPTVANGPFFARIVREKADLRRLAELAVFIEQGVFGDTRKLAAEVGDQIRERLAGLDDAPGSGPGFKRWSEIVTLVDAEVAAAADPNVESTELIVPTGFVDLDRLLDGGFRAPQFIVLAARTGLGKSVATNGFAANAAFRHNMPAAVFSLEMFDTQIGKRLLSAESRVPLQRLKSGELDDQDWTRFARAMGETADAPLFIDSSPSITLADIRSRCRRLKRTEGLALVVVDYLQLVETTGRSENRQQAVGAVSRGLKLLAMELQVPVIGVSQLNRGPEQRADKRPIISDLRESGEIENHADAIILLHRDDYYDKESPRAGEADFIVAKVRDGATDTVTVAAQLHLSRFVDMAIV